MSDKSDANYEAGYRKPPKKTRFKKGISGNPSGRRRKAPPSQTPGSIIAAIDNEEIEVNDKGKRKRMSKAEVEFRQLFAKAIKGELSAARLVVALAAEHLAAEIRDERDYEFIGETDAKRRFGRNYLYRIQELNISRGFLR